MNIISSQDSNNSIKTAFQPFSSIIITSYNRAPILKKTLDTLISLTEQWRKAILRQDLTIRFLDGTSGSMSGVPGESI
jgi:hypothetical protein